MRAQKGGCQFLSVLLRCGLTAGDVGLDAKHDAHGEDADDCGDAGDRRVQRDLLPLSVPRLGPLRIHKVVLLRPRFQGPTQCQARFPVIQHRNRRFPRYLSEQLLPSCIRTYVCKLRVYTCGYIDVYRFARSYSNKGGFGDGRHQSRNHKSDT